MSLTPELEAQLRRRNARIESYRRRFERFAREQLKVKPKIPGAAVAFELNPAQMMMHEVAQKQIKQHGWVRICQLKARQQGSSTYWSGRLYQLAGLSPNVNALVIAHDKDTARHIFDITRFFYDNTEEEIRPVSRYASKAELVFENPDEKTRTQLPGLRSKIAFTTAKDAKAGTGQTIHALQMSEAAKYANAEQLDQSLFPAIPQSPGTIVVVESTAWPSGTWFKQFCERAQSGKTPYEFIFTPWFLSPEYRVPLDPGEAFKLDPDEKHLVKDFALTPEQLKFRRMKIAEWGGDEVARDKFLIEYPHDPELAWTQTQFWTFDHRKLVEMRMHHVKPPRRRADVMPGPRIFTNPHGKLAIWEEPVPGEIYDLGIDSATGSEEGDYSVISVVNRKAKEQAAEWRGHIGPYEFADLCRTLGFFYNTGQLGVEVNGIGFAVNDAIVKAGYPYVYLWRRRGTGVPEITGYVGWKTAPDSKSLMVSLTRHLLTSDQFTIHSDVLLNEMRTFCTMYTPSGNETWCAASGCYDDAVMAFMLALIIGDDESFGIPADRRKPEPPKLVDPALVDQNLLRGIGSENPLDRLAQDLKGYR